MTALVEHPPVPSFKSILRSGAPRFAREAFGPVAAFYLGWKFGNLATGIVLATAFAVALELYEHRRGRRGTLALISAGFVVIQGVVGLIADSAVVYLAQPVIVSAIWGIACFVSVALGRPLMGAFADAWYAFPPEIRATQAYRRIFGVESIVWGVYFVLRSGVRMLVLATGSIGLFVVVQAATGVPFMVVLILWSVSYAVRGFERAVSGETSPEAAPSATR
jgi:intracellular septation protein A